MQPTNPDLPAALRALRDEIDALMFDGLPVDAHRRGFASCKAKALVKLDALLAPGAPTEQAERTCDWREDADGVSQTACGHTFALDDSSRAAENGLRFCHFCGGRINLVPAGPSFLDRFLPPAASPVSPGAETPPRLVDLARQTASVRHCADAVDGKHGIEQRNGHVWTCDEDSGFGACPHPDCALVRAASPQTPPRAQEVTPPKRHRCKNFCPPTWTGPWRDWHRGHGCHLDPDAKGALPQPREEEPSQ